MAVNVSTLAIVGAGKTARTRYKSRDSPRRQVVVCSERTDGRIGAVQFPGDGTIDVRTVVLYLTVTGRAGQCVYSHCMTLVRAAGRSIDVVDAVAVAAQYGAGPVGSQHDTAADCGPDRIGRAAAMAVDIGTGDILGSGDAPCGSGGGSPPFRIAENTRVTGECAGLANTRCRGKDPETDFEVIARHCRAVTAVAVAAVIADGRKLCVQVMCTGLPSREGILGGHCQTGVVRVDRAADV